MLKALLKVKFRTLFAALTNQNGKGKHPVRKAVLFILLFVLCFAACFVAFIGLFTLLSLGLAGTGYEWLLLAVAGILILITDFITSVFIAKSQLFEAKDNELLLSLPVSPRDILLSRMVFVLAPNYLFELIIAIPAYIMWCVMGMGTWVNGILYVVCLIFLPLLACAIAAFFGWLLSVAVKRMKRKNLYKILLSVLGVALYMVTVPWLQVYMTMLMTHKEQVAEGIKTFFAPFYLMANGVASENVFHILLFALCMTLPFALVCYILSRTFLSVVTSSRDGVKQASKRKEKAGDVGRSLIKKEFRLLGSSVGYLLNAGIGVLFLLAAPVGFFFLDLETTLGMLPIALPDGIGAYVGIMALVILNGMVFFSAPSISLEGENIYVLKSLPISAKAVFMAKAKMHMCITCPVTLIGSIIAIIALPTNVFMAVMTLVVPQIASVFIALFGVVSNMLFPKFHFDNETQVVKQSMSVGMAMIVGMLGGVLICNGLMALGIVISSMEVATILLAAILALAAWLSYRFIDRKSEDIMARF